MPDAHLGARPAPDTTSCSLAAPSGLHKPAAGCALPVIRSTTEYSRAST